MEFVMRVAGLFLLSLCLGVAGGGCSSSLGRPNWANPGPVAYQQHQAQRFDPFPEDDLGPPIVGGRPREYDRPREPAPLLPNPAFGAIGGAAPPVQLPPTPGAYSPGPYPQTPYVAPR
jgi:hypothetical protein